MPGIPSDIVLADLTEPPVKANVSPFIATRTDLRAGDRPTNNPPAAPAFTLSATPTTITATITNGNGAASYQIRLESGTSVDGVTLFSLSPNTPYSVQLRGINEYGPGPWSDAEEITTAEAGEGLTAIARRFALNRTFNGTPGVKTSLESNGFDDVDGNSRYSSEQAYEGATSGKMTLLLSDNEASGGSGGFGRWGGIIYFPTELQAGDEFFMRFRMYYPSGFDHYTSGGGGHVKFIRFRTEDASGNNAGYIDVYWDFESASTTYKYIKEFSPNQWSYFGPKASYPHVFNNWVTYNVHVILSNSAQTGRFRMWRDGELMTNLSVVTLSGATHVCTRFHLFTYWNGQVPQEQSCYVDDVVITSDAGETQTHAPSGLQWIGE